MPTYNNPKYLSLPQQVQKNKDDVETLKNKLKNYIDALKDHNGWKSQLLTLTPLEPQGTIATATLLLYDTLKLQVKNTVTSFVDTDSVEVTIGVVTGNKIQLSDTSVYLEIGATNSMFVAPTGWELQIVGIKYTELKAIDTTYDNTESGMTETTVQGAIDELDTQVDSHINSFTPHKLQDIENSRELLWGFEIDTNGILNITLKEII